MGRGSHWSRSCRRRSAGPGSGGGQPHFGHQGNNIRHAKHCHRVQRLVVARRSLHRLCHLGPSKLTRSYFMKLAALGSRHGKEQIMAVLRQVDPSRVEKHEIARDNLGPVLLLAALPVFPAVVWSLPSTYTLEPLTTYSPTISARRCHATMLCDSVRSCLSSFRSLNLPLVARLKLATGVPLGEYLTSGSLPTFPTRMTLFTLLGISALL